MHVSARKHWSKPRLSLVLILALCILFLGLVGLRAVFPLDFRDDILEWSTVYNLDPAWVAAVIRCESNFEPDAISVAGAVGLMQIMPSTGVWIAEQLDWPDFRNIDLIDASTNIALGTWYLRHLLDRFDTTTLALMAFNAGPSRVEDWLSTGEPPFPETAAYVKRVQHCLPIYRILLHIPWLYTITPN